MASIYDKASLVLIPSGTKTSKVYSQVPTNGDGDFTFSRSTAATRVNASGNIEKETQNLLLQSNSFLTSWVRSGYTLTSGQSGYDGSSNAWLAECTSAGQALYQTSNASGVSTFSMHLKEGTANFLRLRADQSVDAIAVFDLSNGSVHSFNGNVIDTNVVDLGGGWYRCSITWNIDTLSNVQVRAEDGNGSPILGTFYIQDAQLEQGLVARDYIETTTTAIYGGITDNVPRLDYTDSSCPALLLEPQRTNICPNSEDVSNWYLTFATATPNDAISPEGVQNAAKIVTSNSGCDVKLTSIPVSPSTTYTASFYCKLTSGSGLQTRFYDNTNGANIEYYDYTSQVAVGEWKRVTRTFTTPAGCNNIQIWFLAASSSASVTAHYWGYQLEAGSYSTSYIPTYGSAVTRNGDSANVLNLDTNNIVGDTQWSFLAEFDVDGNAPSTDKIRFTDASGQPRVYLYNDAAGFAGGWGGAFTAGQNRVKVLWRLNTLRSADIFGAGEKKVSVTAQPSDLIVDRLLLNGNQGTFKLYNIIIFPTALTDQEAIDLTTL